MRALNTTVGVYILANFVIKFSDFDFLELAFSTRSRILDAVDSSNFLVVLIMRTPDMLIHPLITSSPLTISLGRLSPVSALVFRVEVPSVTIPSMGIFSPGLTIIIEPVSTSSGSTLSICPLNSMLA